MTQTPTTSLAGLLSAKRAEVEAPQEPTVEEVEVIVHPEIHMSEEVTEHGEIVPAAPPQVVEYEPTYPSIPPKVVGGLPYVRDYMKLARTIHSTEMVPVAFRGRPDAILACFMRGYELGFGPMQALDSFNVIQGKVGLTAESMRALIMDNGHQIILRDGEDATTARCRRSDWPAGEWEEYTYSMIDAATAGLLAKDAWKKNPRAMLDARATSGAGRRHFADVLAGMSYTPEEIRDFGNDNDGGASSQATPPPPTPTSTPPGTGNPSLPSESSPPTSAESESSSASLAAPVAEDGSPTESTSTLPAPGPTPPAKRKRVADRTPEEQAQVEADSAARLELRKGLTAIINNLDRGQQPIVRAYLAQHGWGDLPKLSASKLQDAINIVAGWPDSVAVPEVEGVDYDGDVEDAEIVDDNDAQTLMDQLR